MTTRRELQRVCARVFDVLHSRTLEPGHIDLSEQIGRCADPVKPSQADLPAIEFTPRVRDAHSLYALAIGYAIPDDTELLAVCRELRIALDRVRTLYECGVGNLFEDLF